MDYTQNLHLPQWEADDRIMHDDFNNAFAALDAGVKAANDAAAAAPRIVTGTYTGDGGESVTIEFPFVPKFVVISGSGILGLAVTQSGSSLWISMSGSAVQGCRYALTGTTFVLTHPNLVAAWGMNMNGDIYRYIAFA